MGAYTGIVNLIGNACELAKSMGYPESSVCVLEGDEDKIKEKFPDTYSSLISCKHNMDKRSVSEYGRDLVASWLFEDFIIRKLSENGLDVRKNGSDRNREILPSLSISPASDCTVAVNGKKRCMEIICDYSGWWKRNGQVDLRDGKYKSLLRENSMLLGISFTDKLYFLISDIGSVDALYIPNHKPYGDKPAYKITVSNSDFKNIDFSEMAKDITASI